MKREDPRVSTVVPGPAGGRREKLARLCHRTGALSLLRSVHGALSGNVRILAYHRVLETARPDGFRFDVDLISASAEKFHGQMSSIRRHFHPMRFDEMLECIDSGKRLPRRAVLVTFDDGYDDNHRVAYPILRDLGMSAMFFVSTGHIDSGKPYSYDWLVHMLCSSPRSAVPIAELGTDWELPESLHGRRLAAAALLDRIKFLDAGAQEALVVRLENVLGMPRREGHADCRPMNWNQLREMREGGMEIGSHGVRHRMLGRLPHAEMRAEVHDSKARLEQELGARVDVISYPVGSADAFNAAVVDEVRGAGYRMACSYITGVGRPGPENAYSMPRLPVEIMDDSWFEAMVAVPEVFSYPLRRRARA
jgi:peptidoglycan/xylan/chitin deacetylase (PgdA/CDA1 family)